MTYQEHEILYTKGTNKPKLTIPEHACDSHHHIFDPDRFPYQPWDKRHQPPATFAEYKLLQKRLSLERNVIVTPSAYGTDNVCTLDGVKQAGYDKARAVVTVDETVSDDELKEMNECGVSGIRFNIVRSRSEEEAAKVWETVISLDKRIASMNWFISFWMPADLTVEKQSVLADLNSQIVFDHRGHIPADAGLDHPAVRVIDEFLRNGKAWVKLSALYHDSKCDDYMDTIAIGSHYVQVNPDRIIWGTDWPHPNLYTDKKPYPNDADLLDLLMEQAQSEENFKKILVDNPAKLFGFK